MDPKAKPVRRWHWYLAIGALTPTTVLAFQSTAVGLSAAKACADLEAVSVSVAMNCKWNIWLDIGAWTNWRFLWIAGFVVVCVGLAMWQADRLSSRGLNGGPRDAHSVRVEYRPIVGYLVGFTLLALFVNLVNATAGRFV